MLQPFHNWIKLNERVKAHSVSPFHLKCVMAMECFKDAHSGLQPTIDTSFDKRRQELYDLNCKRLEALVDCMVLCRKQNIPLRGHHDSNLSNSFNKENFKAILEFRALPTTDGAKCTIHKCRYTK